jgi:hypothetical protein
LDVIFGTSVTGGVRVPVEAFVLGPNDDLAVLTLGADAPTWMILVPIDPNGDLHWGHQLTIAGYGKTSTSSGTGVLNKATWKYISPEYLIERTADYGERPTAIGPCEGDMGTPAFSLHFNRQGCIGIKGPISSCEGQRHTYLDARFYKAWIDSQVPPKQAEGGYIVDNNDTQFSTFQNFTVSSNSGHYGADSLVRQGNGTSSTNPGLAMWFPNLPTTRRYDVFAWWVPGTNRATVATYTINHRDGQSKVTVNQSSASTANRWNKLGTWTFNAGTSGNVVLSSAVSTTLYVSADALLFVPQTLRSDEWQFY